MAAENSSSTDLYKQINICKPCIKFAAAAAAVLHSLNCLL